MAITYKVNVLEKLKEKGYSSYKLRKEQLIGQGALQKIREGGLPSWHELDLFCEWLGCQPGDLIQYEPSEEGVIQ